MTKAKYNKNWMVKWNRVALYRYLLWTWHLFSRIVFYFKILNSSYIISFPHHQWLNVQARFALDIPQFLYNFILVKDNTLPMKICVITSRYKVWICFHLNFLIHYGHDLSPPNGSFNCPRLHIHLELRLASILNPNQRIGIWTVESNLILRLILSWGMLPVFELVCLGCRH